MGLKDFRGGGVRPKESMERHAEVEGFVGGTKWRCTQERQQNEVTYQECLRVI